LSIPSGDARLKVHPVHLALVPQLMTRSVANDDKHLAVNSQIKPERNTEDQDPQQEEVQVLAVGYRNYRLDVMIGLKPSRLSYMTAILDTGASLSLIRESCLPKAWRKGTVEKPHPKVRIVDANGNRVTSTAVVYLHVQVGRSVVRQRFLVVPNLSVLHIGL